VAQDQQAIEKLKRNCWHHEQIHRNNSVSVIAEKCPPAWDGGRLLVCGRRMR